MRPISKRCGTSAATTPTWQGLRCRCWLRLSEHEAGWYWRVIARNETADAREVDLVCAQDVGIASPTATRANEAYDALSGIDGVLVNRPCGAFYMAIVFEDGTLNAHQSLPIANDSVREMIEGLVADGRSDQRFVYYLMGATGICVVPLSGFYCKREGFRITLLECDDVKRAWMLKTLAESLKQYVAS